MFNMKPVLIDVILPLVVAFAASQGEALECKNCAEATLDGVPITDEMIKGLGLVTKFSLRACDDESKVDCDEEKSCRKSTASFKIKIPSTSGGFAHQEIKTAAKSCEMKNDAEDVCETFKGQFDDLSGFTDWQCKIEFLDEDQSNAGAATQIFLLLMLEGTAFVMIATGCGLDWLRACF